MLCNACTTQISRCRPMAGASTLLPPGAVRYTADPQLDARSVPGAIRAPVESLPECELTPGAVPGDVLSGGLAQHPRGLIVHIGNEWLGVCRAWQGSGWFRRQSPLAATARGGCLVPKALRAAGRAAKAAPSAGAAAAQQPRHLAWVAAHLTRDQLLIHVQRVVRQHLLLVAGQVRHAQVLVGAVDLGLCPTSEGQGYVCVGLGGWIGGVKVVWLVCVQQGLVGRGEAGGHAGSSQARARALPTPSLRYVPQRASRGDILRGRRRVRWHGSERWVGGGGSCRTWRVLWRQVAHLAVHVSGCQALAHGDVRVSIACRQVGQGPGATAG